MRLLKCFELTDRAAHSSVDAILNTARSELLMSQVKESDVINIEIDEDDRWLNLRVFYWSSGG